LAGKKRGWFSWTRGGIPGFNGLGNLRIRRPVVVIRNYKAVLSGEHLENIFAGCGGMEKARCALPFTPGFLNMAARFLANDQALKIFAVNNSALF